MDSFVYAGIYKKTQTQTLALSNLILFYLMCLFCFILFFNKKKTQTCLTLYQLHIYSLTARFSYKTNTVSLFYILYTRFLKKKILCVLR